ncbi:MAG TPA: LptF/LptG family permease [Gemmatimonadaceae bacterium]|nr:LptF/LptG family permease [Gemmatimonadaceae bacterium]
MKIIGRYVLKEHVGPFVFASTALTSLMLLQYIAKKFGELVGRGLPKGVIAEFMALSIPFTVAMTMPMAVLVAVLYAFSRLAAENEITAMKASGIGMRSVLVPVLLGGLGMSVVMLGFNDQVLPRANHRLAVLQLDIFRTKPTFALREQVINEVKPGQLYLRANDIDEGTSRMKDVTIYDLSDPARRRTIYADSGTLSSPNNSDLDLTLFHGEMREVPNTNSAELTRMFYRRDRLRVKNIFSSYQQSSSGTVSKGDREMSICEMHREMQKGDFRVRDANYDIAQAKWERAGRKGARPRPPKFGEGYSLSKVYCGLLSLAAPKETKAQAPGPARQLQRLPSDSARQLQEDNASGYQSRVQEAQFRRTEAQRERNRYDVEIQKKFSLAAACTIFVLVGAPIALRFPRGGVGLVIGVSFAIFGLYYVGLIGGETLADKGYLPPWVAMWAANLLLLIAGLALASRMGRESSTSRGGDFRELLAAARARVFGWLRPLGLPVERRRA